MTGEPFHFLRHAGPVTVTVLVKKSLQINRSLFKTYGA
jgi:hypothetical protein